MRSIKYKFLLLCALLLATPALAWRTDGNDARWPNGDIVIYLHFGKSPKLSDGTTYNDNAVVAMKDWNACMEDLRLTAVSTNATRGTAQNGLNEVFFSPDVYGVPWDPNVPAVTVKWFNGATRTEADILLNPNWNWDSYRSSPQLDGSGKVLMDIRRILLQQLGYLLGLGVTEGATTDPDYRHLYDILLEDDKIGITNLYGFGPGSVLYPPVIQKVFLPQTVYVGDPFSFSIQMRPPALYPLVYEWQRNGVSIPGVTTNSYEKIAELADDGAYRVLVRYARAPAGAEASTQEVTLTVRVPPLPSVADADRFYEQVLATTQTFEVWFWVTPFTQNYTQQWYKNGVAIPGATDMKLKIDSVAFEDAGDYVFVATNSSGSTTTNIQRLTVTPPLVPVFDSLSKDILQSIASVRFVAKLSGTKPVTVTWYKNGVKLPPDRFNASENTSLLPAPGVTDHFVAKATNMAGTTFSEEMTVTGAVDIPRRLPAEAVYGYEGLPLTLLNSQGLSGDRFQWYADGVPLEGETAYQLTLTPTPADSGKQYVLKAFVNGYEILHGPFTLRVQARGLDDYGRTSATAWEQVFRVGNRVHFVMAKPRRIEVYDLAAKSWSPSIAIDENDKMYQVSGDRIYFLGANGLKSVDLSFADLRTEIAEINYMTAANFLVVEGKVYASVYVTQGYKWTRFDLATKVREFQSKGDVYPWGPIAAFDPLSGAIVSNYQLRHHSLQATGDLAVEPPNSRPSTWLSAVPSKCFFATNLKLGITSAGAVTSLSDGSYVGSLGGAVETAIEQGEGLLVLSGDQINLFDAQLLLRKRKTLDACASHLEIYEDTFTTYSFAAEEGARPVVREIPASSLEDLPPRMPSSDPLQEPGITALGYNKDGQLVLADDAKGYTYFWNPESRTLSEGPTHPAGFHSLAIFPAGDIIFGTDNLGMGAILSASTGELLDDKNFRVEAKGATAAGDHLMIRGRSRTFVFDKARHIPFDFSVGFFPGSSYSWASEARTFFVQDGRNSPLWVVKLSPEGILDFGNPVDSLFIREAGELKGVDPEGLHGIFDSGLVFRLVDGSAEKILGVRVGDVLWKPNALYLMQRDGYSTLITRRAALSEGVLKSVRLEGSALRLIDNGNGYLTALTLRGGTTCIHLLDADLNRLSEAPLSNPVSLLQQPESKAVSLGSTASLSVSIPEDSGAASYMWFHDGQFIESPGLPTLTLAQVDAGDAGSYYCEISTSKGTTRSASATITVDPVGARLANLSTRSYVKAGEASSIAGFFISGTEAKTVLIRAAGPSLKPFGISYPYPDPVLTLYSGSTSIALNDSWGLGDPGLTEAFKTVGAFSWMPESRDAAMLVSLPPGPYTAILSGPSENEGVGLVEVYEMDGSSDSNRMSNLSTRSFVRSGENIQIGGLSVRGPAEKTLLIRAAGPALTAFGVAQALSDPVITLLSGPTPIKTNDNWTEGVDPELSISDTAQTVGAFPFVSGSRDAALLATLKPGNYTIQVSSAGASEGIALVEVYEVR